MWKRIQKLDNTNIILLTYDATSWRLRAIGPWYRTRSVRSVVVAGVARQQPMLLGPTVVVIVGLRDALLSGLHHLLVLASSVLEPDLDLQQTECVTSSVIASDPDCTTACICLH
jgi:hypothetical protein